eukprot:scaffold83265_cov18-Tisochrysis_lutea.AAC.1
MHPPSALSMGVRCGHIGLERQSLNSNIIRQNPASRLVLKYLDRTLGRSLLDIINQDKVNPKYLPGTRTNNNKVPFLKGITQTSALYRSFLCTI